MGLESFPLLKGASEKNKTEDKTPEAKALPEIYAGARTQFEFIFDHFSDPGERMSEISERLNPFLKHISEDVFPKEKIKEVLEALEKCLIIQEKELFLNEIMKALQPILDLHESHLAKFEEARAHAMNEAGGFTEINRLLFYGKDGSIIHIHAPHGKSIDNKITLYREGIRKLAEVVEKDPEIKEISPSSYLVAEHPGIFQTVGFKVEDASPEFRQARFPDEEREIKIATINRGDFLKRFIKK